VVLRILPSEAHNVEKEGIAEPGWGLGHGMLTLVSAMPCVLAIYKAKENVCQSLVMRHKRKKPCLTEANNKKKKSLAW
jgi:hypothetical protein